MNLFRRRIVELSLSTGDFEALVALDTAEEQSRYIRGLIPDGYDFEDPMPISRRQPGLFAGDDWDRTLTVVEET